MRRSLYAEREARWVVDEEAEPQRLERDQQERDARLIAADF
jgi:hypothetical protein